MQTQEIAMQKEGRAGRKLAVFRAPHCARKAVTWGGVEQSQAGAAELSFKLRRRRHPQATFKDYFAAIATSRAAASTPA
jgi:hypothetical protein